MAKGKRGKVRLNSTEGSGVFYTTTKVRGAAKLVLKKYDKVVRKHVNFEETKKGF